MKMRTRWERGPRWTVPTPTKKDRAAVMVGKNGGPVIEQRVVKIIEPRAAKS